MASNPAASVWESGFLKPQLRDCVDSTLAEASGRYKSWSLAGLASALAFPFRRIAAAPDSEPPLPEGVAQGIAKAESPGGEIADAAGADGLSGDAPAEVERERLDETDGKAAVLAVEPEALLVSEDLVKCVDRSDAIGAALEEAFIVPAATASPPASGPWPPCFGPTLPDFLTDRNQRLAAALLRAPTSSRSPLPSATNRW